MKDQNLLGDAVTVEIFKALVEVLKAPGENRFLAGARELTGRRGELDRRPIKFERMTTVAQQLDAKSGSRKPLNHRYVAVDIDNFHRIFLLLAVIGAQTGCALR